jgi:hypothetical protein
LKKLVEHFKQHKVYIYKDMNHQPAFESWNIPALIPCIDSFNYMCNGKLL